LHVRLSLGHLPNDVPRSVINQTLAEADDVVLLVADRPADGSPFLMLSPMISNVRASS